MKRDELRETAKLVSEGTGWKLVDYSSSDHRHELIFEHQRGDRRTVLISEKVADELVVQRIHDILSLPLSWPDWERGGPCPTFELHLPWTDEETELAAKCEKLPAIMNFELGTMLMVAAVDLDRHVVTLVPKAPWNVTP